MPVIKSKDGLKSFLLTSRILSPSAWAKVEGELAEIQDVPTALQILERRQLLTPFQTGRILKNETEGLVLGRYKLLYRNASGSFARVFRAESVDDGKMVALKLLRERWVDDPRTVAGFVREARICQKFVHPNIVPILDVGNEGRFYYFTMEFVEGGNLRDFMKIRKTLSPLEATRCIYQICLALEYALKMGASHRDLKLTNVLMSSSGVARLVDFGLAGAENPSQAGTSDDVQRALEYSTLERGTNAPRNDPRSDIFFAGSIYYELLCGEGPWTRTLDREEKLMLTRYSNVRPLRQVIPGLPSGVYKIVQTMMELNPSSRYQSCTEVNKDLRALLAELGEVVEDPGGRSSSPQSSSASKSASSASAKSDRKNFNLLVVEAGRKREKKLKQYFEQHAFVLTFIESAADAFERLKSKSPPDGVLFLADADSAPVMEVYPKVQAYARTLKVPCVALFAAEDSDAVKKLIYPTKFGATMFQPTSPRDLRQHFAETAGFDTGPVAPPESPKRKETPPAKNRPKSKSAKPENQELDDLDVDSDTDDSSKESDPAPGLNEKIQNAGGTSQADSAPSKDAKSPTPAALSLAIDSAKLLDEVSAAISPPKPAAPLNATQKAAAIRAAQRAAEKAAIEQAAREAEEKANSLIAEAERVAAEKATAEEAVRRKAEEERLAHERAVSEKAEAERQEVEKAARMKAEEEERIAREKADTERKAAEKIARKKAEKEERIAREKAEAERKAAEKVARIKAEEERLAREKAEAERIAAEQEAARIKAEEERLAAERAAAAERARVEIEQLEKAMAEKFAAARQAVEEQQAAATEAAEMAMLERQAAQKLAEEKLAAERAIAERERADREATEKTARAERAQQEAEALALAMEARIAAARRVASGLDPDDQVVANSPEDEQLLAELKAEEVAKAAAAARAEADEEQLLAEIEAEAKAAADLQTPIDSQPNPDRLSADDSFSAWTNPEGNADAFAGAPASPDDALQPDAQAKQEVDDRLRLEEEARAERLRVATELADQKKVKEAKAKQSISPMQPSRSEKKSGKKKSGIPDRTSEVSVSIEAPREEPSKVLHELPSKENKTADHSSLSNGKSGSGRTREPGKLERLLREENDHSESRKTEKTGESTADAGRGSSKLIIFVGVAVAIVAAVVWVVMFS